MFNEESIKAVDETFFSKKFMKPLYGSYCFSRIPATVSYLLTGEGKEKALPSSCYQDQGPYDGVILFFLDAFGWRFLNRYKEHPFLQRFINKGLASKLTTQFPSTTSAHVTTIHTGLEVGTSGIYEWFQYEPKVDKIISPLLFSCAGDQIEHSLLSSTETPSSLFPFSSIYERLHEKNITSYVFQDVGISGSPYSQVVTKGAHPVGYFNLKQGLESLQELFMGADKEKKYAFFYYANIDSNGHRNGINSKPFDKTIKHCLDTLEKELFLLLNSSEKKIAVLVTADHGMVDVYPKKTIYLNKEIPEIVDWLKTNQEGNLLVPAGSCRDFFLHIKEEYLEKALATLSFFLEGKAEVYKVQDLITDGFFGENLVSERFTDRVGNLVVLPYEGEAVWWFEKHKFQQNFYAAHGGLTRGEAETIFLSASLGV